MTESIELIVTVNGTTFPVRCDLPSVLIASDGPMSIRSALEPSVCLLLDRMVEILDVRMERPRIARVDSTMPRIEPRITRFVYGSDLKPSA